ncbi:MAG: DUF559 domain-containing protein, partial [Verrucomicrobiota bacterium]
MIEVPRLTGIARTLRKNDTWAEKLVWGWLRGHRFCDYKFRRQHQFGPHLLDFFCLEALLNIELDGSQHGFPTQQRADEERDAYLEARGIQVLRFWNSRLRRDKDAIRDTIFRSLQERCPHPLPSYCSPVSFVEPREQLVCDRALPPHPGPLPQGEGVSDAALGKSERVGLAKRR